MENGVAQDACHLILFLVALLESDQRGHLRDSRPQLHPVPCATKVVKPHDPASALPSGWESSTLQFYFAVCRMNQSYTEIK